jgi:hypothetical protein
MAVGALTMANLHSCPVRNPTHHAMGAIHEGAIDAEDVIADEDLMGDVGAHFASMIGRLDHLCVGFLRSEGALRRAASAKAKSSRTTDD